MKKFFALCCLMVTVTVQAQKVTMGGVTYQIKDGHAIIYDIDKNASEVTVEGYVMYKGKKYMVTEQREWRKNGSWYQPFRRNNAPNLRHVTFSTTCTEILPELFCYSNIETVTISNTVTKIGKNAFGDKFDGSNLREIVIPNSIKEIGIGAFAGCKNLKSIVLPNSLDKIDNGTFINCSSLQEIVIPQSVKTIGYDAFISNIYDIVLPDGVMLDKNAFHGYHENINKEYGADNLTNVKYHSGKVATDLMEYFHSECPFVKNGGKLRNPDFDKPLLAKYNAATGGIAKPIIQEPEMSVPDVTMENVDQNIPVAKKAQPKTFVLIIANEEYTKEAKVPYAVNDGNSFERYCRQTLGIPQKNIHKAVNATLNNMKYEIDWLRKVLMAYKGEARAIVYYAGHGIPDETSKTGFLLPVDGYGNSIASGYALSELYKMLSEQPSQSVTVFLDACFSGTKREGDMMASARGVAIKVKASKPEGKLVVFSASQDDETAYPLKEQQHGLFTYYLLKKLKEKKGDVTYGELSNYIAEQVLQESIVSNGKSQTPTVSASALLADSWRSMKLK